jgi:hypothetical protein
MNKCLKCGKEYEAQRSTSKFCSNKCRSAFNRKNPTNGVTRVQMQVLYNSIMEAVSRINAKNGQPEPVVAVFVPKQAKAAVLDYNEAKALISSATSSVELETAWQRVQQQEWSSWQMKTFLGLKEIQQTKIDF